MKTIKSFILMAWLAFTSLSLAVDKSFHAHSGPFSLGTYRAVLYLSNADDRAPITLSFIIGRGQNLPLIKYKDIMIAAYDRNGQAIALRIDDDYKQLRGQGGGGGYSFNANFTPMQRPVRDIAKIQIGFAGENCSISFDKAEQGATANP